MATTVFRLDVTEPGPGFDAFGFGSFVAWVCLCLAVGRLLPRLISGRQPDARPGGGGTARSAGPAGAGRGRVRIG